MFEILSVSDSLAPDWARDFGCVFAKGFTAVLVLESPGGELTAVATNSERAKAVLVRACKELENEETDPWITVLVNQTSVPMFWCCGGCGQLLEVWNKNVARCESCKTEYRFNDK